MEHDLVAALKTLAGELGRTPMRAEFENSVVGGRYKLDKAFKGSFTLLLQAAGIDPLQARRTKYDSPTNKQENKLISQYKAICSRREQIQGFFRSSLDLEEMFERAGNPQVLKLSAQPDTHAKFVDRPAFNAYAAWLKYWKPDVHLIMGDFVDCEGLSHWPEESLQPRRIVPEMKLARQLLQELVDATPTCSSRIYLTGNHEDWITQALTRMPELFDGLAELDIEVSLNTLLGLPKYGYQLFPLNELVKIGKAHFTHGIYTSTHHAKAHLDKFKTNIYYAHLHDMQEHNQTSIEGNMEAATFGCLCRLDAKFLKGKPNNWAHGAAAFEFYRDGSYNFYKLRISGGRLAYNGLLFDGNITT